MFDMVAPTKMVPFQRPSPFVDKAVYTFLVLEIQQSLQISDKCSKEGGKKGLMAIKCLTKMPL